jgi:hypothetical protein
MNLAVARSYLSRNITKTRYAAREQRNLEFTIDTDYVMNLLVAQNGKCALTGWDFEFTRGGNLHGKNPYGCTMDRKDNSLGYIPGNVQLVCWKINKLKGEVNDTEFKTICKLVVEHA